MHRSKLTPHASPCAGCEGQPPVEDSAAFWQHRYVFPQFAWPGADWSEPVSAGKAFKWWTHPRAMFCSPLASLCSPKHHAGQASCHIQILWSSSGDSILDTCVLSTGSVPWQACRL